MLANLYICAFFPCSLIIYWMLVLLLYCSLIWKDVMHIWDFPVLLACEWIGKHNGERIDKNEVKSSHDIFRINGIFFFFYFWCDKMEVEGEKKRKSGILSHFVNIIIAHLFNVLVFLLSNESFNTLSPVNPFFIS